MIRDNKKLEVVKNHDAPLILATGGPGNDSFSTPEPQIIYFKPGTAPDEIKPEDIPNGGGGADLPYVYWYNKSKNLWVKEM